MVAFLDGALRLILQPLHLLIFAIVVLAFVTVLFSALVLFHRLWMTRLDAHRGRMQEQWIGVVFRYMSDKASAADVARMVRLEDLDAFTDMVVHLIESIDGEDRERLTRLFEEMGIVSHYLTRLGDRNRWLRIYAVHFLGMVRARAAVPALVSLLEDRDDVVAFAAAQSLSQIRDREHLGQIVDVLTRRENWSEGAVAEILLEFGPDVAGGLLPLLRQPDLLEKSRFVVVDLLGYLRHLPALPTLVCLLDETAAPELKARILRALGRMASPEATAIIERYANYPGDPVVRLEAVRALGLIGQEESLEHLREALQDGDWNVRHESAWGLIHLGQPGIAELRERASADGQAGAISRQVLAEYEIGITT